VVLKFSPVGSMYRLKSAEQLQPTNHLHVAFVRVIPVHSLEAVELVNDHHEGLASLQRLGLGTQFYAYSMLRNQ
jgi:hypothetical protein